MWAVLTEDEKMLRETVDGFFAENAPVSQLRALRDRKDEKGYNTGLWQSIAEMGLNGVIIDEQFGGSQMGYVAAGLVAEAMGRNLSASPFITSSIISTTILRGASPEMKSETLPNIVSGKLIVALASEEGNKHNPTNIQMRATPSGNGYKLNGSKTMVVDGHIADKLIVSAQTPEGLALFLLPRETKGLSVSRTIMVDSRNYATADFKDVEVTGEQIVGTIADAEQLLQKAFTVGQGILAAEMLGAASQVFDLTAAYLRERKQFGRIIGEFQALQHRAAHLYCELENARSAVLSALRALDNNDEKVEIFAAMAKAKLGSVAKLSALEAVQLHGGMGMTDELDIGLYLKRIRVLQELFGDGDYHADRLATLREN